jgi:hypothetical protein
MKVNVVKKSVKEKMIVGAKTKENIIMTIFGVWLLLSALGMVLANDFLSCVRVAIASGVSAGVLIVALKNFFGRIL